VIFRNCSTEQVNKGGKVVEDRGILEEGNVQVTQMCRQSTSKQTADLPLGVRAVGLSR